MTLVDSIALRDLQERSRINATVGAIAVAVSAETGIPIGAIFGRSLRAPEVAARQRVMWEARQRGLSYPEIGYALGRDHTSVLSGVRREAERRGEPVPGQASTVAATRQALARMTPAQRSEHHFLTRRVRIRSAEALAAMGVTA